MTNLPKRIYLPVPLEVERVGKIVLDAAFKVHTVLGPGLLESVYGIAMKHVIEKGGTLVETEVKLPIIVLLRENYANREDSAVIARALFPKQSHSRRGDCFVGKSALLAMTGRFGCGWKPRYV
jgi:hypothetical protein